MRVLILKRIANRAVRWFDYIFEFIIIFASLYLTFELEDYGEYLNNREKEEVYLFSLYDDLRKDEEQLHRRITEFDDKLNKLELLRLMLNHFQNNIDSIKLLYHQHLDYTFLYNPINNTFESLKSGGDIKLIENQNFKILLSELDKSYKSTINSGLVLKNFREGEIWNGYFVQAIDAETFKLISDDPYLAIKLKNMLDIYVKHAESYFFFLQGTLQKTIEAKAALTDVMELDESNPPEEKVPFNQEADSLFLNL